MLLNMKWSNKTQETDSFAMLLIKQNKTMKNENSKLS